MNRLMSTANVSADLGGLVFLFYRTTWKIERKRDLWKHFKLVSFSDGLYCYTVQQ